MKKITEVRLKNFQSHADTTVKFSSRFNVITGQSDQGKTAIFRGIYWALFNRPNKNDFLRKGCSTMEVAVVFDDGTVIIRHKSATRNLYVLEQGGERRTFDSFGIHPPIEIIMAHGMRLISVGGGKDKESLNFSSQLDGPFLLKDTPGTRAVTIGRMAHTEVVDRSIKNTKTDMRNTSMDVKRLNEDILIHEDKISSFDYLVDLEQEIHTLENLLGQLISKNLFLGKIKDLSAKITREMTRQAEIEQIILLTTPYEHVCELSRGLLEAFKVYSDINRLGARIASENERLRNAEEILEGHARSEEVVAMVRSLEEKIRNYRAISNKMIFVNKGEKDLQNLSEAISSLKDVEESLRLMDECQQKFLQYSHAKNEINKAKIMEERRVAITKQIATELQPALQDAINAYTAKIAEIGKCPLCFSDVEAATIENIGKNLNLG